MRVPERAIVRIALAVLAGAVLYTLALPPFDFAACGWLVIVPLLLLVRGRTPRNAFWVSLLFGCACEWTFAWWLAPATARYFQLSLAPAILGVTVFYLILAIPSFGLFGAGAAVLLRDEWARTRLFLLPALWVAGEVARGRGIGQPWCLLGITQHANTGLIQVASVTGVYGVSFLLALGNTAIAEGLVALRRGRSRTAAPSLGVAGLVIALFWGAGTCYVAAGAAGAGFGTRPVALVQANVEPAYLWTRSYTDRQIGAHLRATEALPAGLEPALIVWPENAVPRYLDTEPMLADRLAALAAERRADLLLGTPRYHDGRIYNSVRLISATGRPEGHYDKQHLIPFAEERPWSRLRTRASRETPDEFSPGAEAGVLPSFVRLGLSICHEIVYPPLVHRAVLGGAELLVNVSNDGWVDGRYTIAGRQHFAMAMFRAVEAHRWIVRAASTGISGIIDPYGRVRESLATGTAGVLAMPVDGRRDLTPYVRFGDAFAFGCALVVAVALGSRRLLAWRRRAALAHPRLDPLTPPTGG
jgi:apolipoprotein N-acyltransferase